MITYRTMLHVRLEEPDAEKFLAICATRGTTTSQLLRVAVKNLIISEKRRAKRIANGK